MPDTEVLAQVDGRLIKDLELHVLTQVRDNMQLMASNMSKMADKLDNVHERVMAIELSKFDERIEQAFADGKDDLSRTEKELQRQIDELKSLGADRENRIRAHDQLLARYGAFLLIFGTVGGAAIAAVSTKVFGG